MKQRLFFILSTLPLLLVLAACGQGSTTNAATTVQVTETEYQIASSQALDATAHGQEKSPLVIPSTGESLGCLYLTCSHNPIFNNIFITAPLSR